MGLFICLCRGLRPTTIEEVLPTHLLATTSDPALVRQIVAGLRLNWLLEDDARDTVIDGGFLEDSEATIAALDRENREAAGRLARDVTDLDA